MVSLPRWFSGKEPTCNAGDTGSILGKDLLEKKMATHSSILAWEIPRTEEPGGLQSLGSDTTAHARMHLVSGLSSVSSVLA